MAKLVKINLTIDDESLLEQVIKPAIQDKRLNSLIVSLLKAYHTNDSVSTVATIYEDMKNSKEREEILSSIQQMRESINDYKFYSEESSNLMKEGLGISSNIKDFMADNTSEPSVPVGYLPPADFVSKQEFNQVVENQNIILEMLSNMGNVSVVSSNFSSMKKSEPQFNKSEPIKVETEPQKVIADAKSTTSDKQVSYKSEDYDVFLETADTPDEKSQEGAELVNSILGSLNF